MEKDIIQTKSTNNLTYEFLKKVNKLQKLDYFSLIDFKIFESEEDFNKNDVKKLVDSDPTGIKTRLDIVMAIESLEKDSSAIHAHVDYLFDNLDPYSVVTLLYYLHLDWLVHTTDILDMNGFKLIPITTIPVNISGIEDDFCNKMLSSNWEYFAINHTSTESIDIYKRSSNQWIPIKTFSNVECLKMSFCAEDKYLVYTDIKKCIILIWDLLNDIVYRRFRFDTSVQSNVSCDGIYLAVLLDRTDVKVFCIDNEQELMNLSFDTHSVENVLISPNGKYILVSGSNFFQIIEVKSQDIILYLKHSRKYYAYPILFSPDSKHIIANGKDDSICFIDFSGNETKKIKVHTDSIDYILVSPDGKLIISGSEEGNNERMWDIQTGKELRKFDIDYSNNYCEGDSDYTYDCEEDSNYIFFSSDSSKVALIIGDEMKILSTERIVEK